MPPIGRTCEARKMDMQLFNDRDPVPACVDDAEVFICDFALCVGCAEALSTYRALGKRLRKANPDDGEVPT